MIFICLIYKLADIQLTPTSCGLYSLHGGNVCFFLLNLHMLSRIGMYEKMGYSHLVCTISFTCRLAHAARYWIAAVHATVLFCMVYVWEGEYEPSYIAKEKKKTLQNRHFFETNEHRHSVQCSVSTFALPIINATELEHIFLSTTKNKNSLTSVGSFAPVPLHCRSVFPNFMGRKGKRRSLWWSSRSSHFTLYFMTTSNRTIFSLKQFHYYHVSKPSDRLTTNPDPSFTTSSVTPFRPLHNTQGVKLVLLIANIPASTCSSLLHIHNIPCLGGDEEHCIMLFVCVRCLI